MLRLRISSGQFPPHDGIYKVRFLEARATEYGLQLLFAVESPYWGLFTYTPKGYKEDSIDGQVVYGGGELESILRALLGDSAPAESDRVVHLVDSGALAGREAEVVVVTGKPVAWEKPQSQAVPAGTA